MERVSATGLTIPRSGTRHPVGIEARRFPSREKEAPASGGYIRATSAAGSLQIALRQSGLRDPQRSAYETEGHRFESCRARFGRSALYRVCRFGRSLGGLDLAQLTWTALLVTTRRPSSRWITVSV